MMSLFNQEKAFEQYVRQYGEERENEGEMKKAQETAIKMKTQGFSDSIISELVGVELNTVQKWLGTPTTMLQ